MEPNFEELLNNTNLTPIQILKYYEEEITNELEFYKNMYWSWLDFCKKDEFEEQKNKVANLILEFTALIKYLTTIHYKSAFFSISIKDKIEELEHEVKCNPAYLHVVTIIEYITQISKVFSDDLHKYMGTNFEQLLNNTNLTPIEILEYYEEAIMNELKICNNMFWSHTYHQSGYAEPKKMKPVEDQNTKVVNLILEFMSLIKYLTTTYYKNANFSSSIQDIIEKLKYQVKHYQTYQCNRAIKEYIPQIIKVFSNDLRKYLKSKSREKERLIILAQEKHDVEEFYVTELNRMLDEKEARIYELETENRKLKLARVLGD